MIIGIGAKPAVGPFESIGLNNKVGGIQVSLMRSLPFDDKTNIQNFTVF